MKYVIKVTDIQDAIQQPIRPVVAKDLNNKMYVSTKMPPLMKTIFHYSDGTTSESFDTVITKLSYESQIPKGQSLTSVEIGNGVISIGEGAFDGCDYLTSVTINSDAIVNKTYTYSYNLSDIFGSQVTEYIIGDNVKGIGKYAFDNCGSLTSITIPNSVTSIGESAFFNCSSLTSITIPNSVIDIREAAFNGCSSLISINVDSNNPNYSSVDGVLFNKDKTTLATYPGGKQGAYTIPNSVSSIEGWAFGNCSSLTSITIPNSVTSIGDNTFAACYSLASVTIPNSVTSIGKDAFSSCISLTSMTIGNGVTSIGNYAFSGCYSLISIICKATTPPILKSGGVFNNTNDCPIYVPTDSVGEYKVATYWSTYADRIQPISE